eukprot:359469-Chlamydomonas_euryale.AAC.7
MEPELAPTPSMACPYGTVRRLRAATGCNSSHDCGSNLRRLANGRAAGGAPLYRRAPFAERVSSAEAALFKKPKARRCSDCRGCSAPARTPLPAGAAPCAPSPPQRQVPASPPSLTRSPESPPSDRCKQRVEPQPTRQRHTCAPISPGAGARGHPIARMASSKLLRANARGRGSARAAALAP